ncbi:hypothetical protein NC651_004082 [Populus alba x Populus x berolinensis]|nr:hypothetical protein NC651_004082 [Populus alba x Populus x berolinensis]
MMIIKWRSMGGVVVRRVDEFNANNNGGFGSGQVSVNPYMVGSVPVHHVGPPAPSAAALEASKELSSIPKMGGFSARAATSAFYAKYHNHNNNEGCRGDGSTQEG